jgi:hypothetical protein
MTVRKKPFCRLFGMVEAALISAAIVGGCVVPPWASTPHVPSRLPVADTTALADCTDTVTTPEEAASVLGNANAGNTICFSGDGLRNAELVLNRSGTPSAPIALRGAGVTVRSVSVAADDVVVDGFVVDGGTGLNLQGKALEARGNTVRRTSRNGINCQPCAEALIQSNTVEGADGAGIIVDGDDIWIRDNVVSGSVMHEMNDADGIRFFGHGHRITGNTIRDITMDGYPDPPHPDCFQTYDNYRRPTTDVIIARNTCVNVAQQCLIASADDAGTHGAVGRSHSIQFVGNTCSVGASQAVLARWFPGVTVSYNQISGSFLRGVFLIDSSTGGTVVGNDFIGCYPQVEADDSSRPGLQSSGNVSTARVTAAGSPALAVAGAQCDG